MKIKSKVLKKIGFDLDGVLIDHGKNRKIIARKLGYRNVFEKTPVSDLEKIVSAWDYKIIEKYIYGWATLKSPVMKESQRTLKNLDKEAELYIISRRHPENREFGRRWLKKYFNFPEKNIIFVDRKKDKRNVAGKLGISIYLDDDISVLKIMPAGVKKILFDQYREHKNGKIGNISVVHSFAGLLNLINSR